jgi:hypothetical protein
MREISLAFHFDFSKNLVKSNIYVPNKPFIQDDVQEEVIDVSGV